MTQSAQSAGKNTGVFERLFPWALALDVEQQWCDQFSELLNRVSTKQQQYQPSWYSSSQSFSSRRFSSALGERRLVDNPPRPTHHVTTKAG